MPPRRDQLRTWAALAVLAASLAVLVWLQARYQACVVMDGPTGGASSCEFYLLPWVVALIAADLAGLVAVAKGLRAVPLALGVVFATLGLLVAFLPGIGEAFLVFAAPLLLAGFVAPGPLVPDDPRSRRAPSMALGVVALALAVGGLWADLRAGGLDAAWQRPLVLLGPGLVLVALVVIVLGRRAVVLALGAVVLVWALLEANPHTGHWGYAMTAALTFGALALAGLHGARGPKRGVLPSTSR